MAHAHAGHKNRHKIIIGIDYGTTFSGVSYVTTEKSGIDDIKVITSWPGEQGTSSKTPTKISYAQENPELKSNKWGFEVKPKHKSYSWTKLLLDKNAEEGDHDDPSLSTIGGSGILRVPLFRGASGVCEDFLHEVYKYVTKKIRQEITAVTFDSTPMECWVTLPAIWSDEAKDATLNAAKKAGFGNRAGDEVYTITEPEAAAIATLKQYAMPGAMNPVKPNESVLICDCGGGTVDITTYVITQVTPQLTFDELQVGAGGKCGATYIDRNLHSLLSKRFGPSFDNVPFSEKGPGSRLMTSFETYKRSFGLYDDQDENMEIGPIRMTVPRSEHYDEEERLVILNYTDMKTLFDPVVEKIENMLSEQIEEARAKKSAKIDLIILVGGFAESPYLFNAIEEWAFNNGEIILIRPDHPQAAVVRGAALRGLEGLAPRVKHARRHYGVCMGKRFREGYDSETLSYIDSMYDLKFCRGRMEWLISKGEETLHGTFRSIILQRDHAPGIEDLGEVRLYACSTADAPEYKTDPRVDLVGVIKAVIPADLDVSDAIKSKFKPNLGKMVHRLKYEVQVVFGGIGSNLVFKVVINGKIISMASFEFDQR